MGTRSSIIICETCKSKKNVSIQRFVKLHKMFDGYLEHGVQFLDRQITSYIEEHRARTKDNKYTYNLTSHKLAKFILEKSNERITMLDNEQEKMIDNSSFVYAVCIDRTDGKASIYYTGSCRLWNNKTTEETILALQKPKNKVYERVIF